MNFFSFRKAREPAPRPPRSPAPSRPKAVWTRDPDTGRLVQSWRASGDEERSCIVRPSGPPALRIEDGGGLRRAA